MTANEGRDSEACRVSSVFAATDALYMAVILAVLYGIAFA